MILLAITIAQATQPVIDAGTTWTPQAVVTILGVLVTLITALGSVVVALTALFHALKAGGKADANAGRIGNNEQSVRSVAERLNTVALAVTPNNLAPMQSLTQVPPENR